MHFAPLALSALVALASRFSSAAPTPQAPPADGEPAPDVPPFQVLTCQAQSIVVRSEWNTAFVVRASSFRVRLLSSS